jgi:serine/threonine protein kinase/Tol biopolymer transport system component
MERFKQIEEIFQEALQRDPAGREAYVHEACGGDAELQREVVSLLVNHKEASRCESWPAAAAAQLISIPRSLQPGQSLGPYRIESFLAAGGMGEVYRATDTRLHRDVAIKVSAARFSERFEREARVIASLNHPHICQLYDVGPNFLVMELVEGPTLADRIKQGALPLDEALGIARQIAEALEAAHEKGRVHRDLKPANIKITPEGVVKVLDFGLAKAAEEPSATVNPSDSPTQTITPTRAGVILGTAAYMSPEQARGQTVDRRADIWSFGVVLYEMLTGRSLFGGPTISDTLAAVLKTEVDTAPLPAQLRPIVERCLRKDPRRRWQAIGDVRVALEEGVPVVQGMDRRYSRLPWMVAGGLMLALVSLAALHFRQSPSQPATVRFQIPPPEGASFSTYLALSPDGRRLAFTANPNDGQPLLWVRALDSLEARPLPGTEGARVPFWSPDSRFLAFAAQSTLLRKIDASGGPAQTLCSASNTIVGGYWSREGVIYFGTLGGGISSVPQAGADPVAVTKPDTAQAENWHAHPQVLPDGRHLLYLSAAGGGNGGIYLGSLDGKEKKRLVAAMTSFSYAPPSGNAKIGHLLFLQQNTLMAQPLDPKSFKPTGDAFTIAEGVGSTRNYALNYAHFTTSANGALAYRSGFGGGQTQLKWFDSAGKLLRVVGARARYSNVVLSRDATRAAVVESDRQTLNTDLWLFDLARGIPTQFTFHEGQNWDPVWSPDGSRVAFSSNRDGPYNLYLKDSSGARPEERLRKSDISERPCDWSSDGRSLMYTRGIGDSARLWVLSDPVGDAVNRKAAPYLEATFGATECQFSPDSHWVAYASNEPMHGHEVYVQSFPVPSSKVRVSSNGGVQPRWRRDGKELFYIAADGKLMAVDVKTLPTFQADSPRSLFDPLVFGGGNSTQVVGYDVTPDGRRFLVNSVPQSGSSAPEPITVVLNWAAGLPK